MDTVELLGIKPGLRDVQDCSRDKKLNSPRSVTDVFAFAEELLVTTGERGLSITDDTEAHNWIQELKVHLKLVLDNANGLKEWLGAL